MGFFGANGEIVDSVAPKTDSSGGWVDGGNNQFLNGKVGEDPIKTAAQEMQATTAAYAMQKAQLGGFVGGGVPTAQTIQAWSRGEDQPQADKYAHLSRDEKIALITQLSKSKPQAVPVQEDDDSGVEMIDPAQELEKSEPAPKRMMVFSSEEEARLYKAVQGEVQKTGGESAAYAFGTVAFRKGFRDSLEFAKQFLTGEQYERAKARLDGVFKKGGPAPAPMSSTHLKKPEKDEVQKKQEKELRDEAKKSAEPDALEGLDTLRKCMKDDKKLMKKMAKKGAKEVVKAANPWAVCHASTGPAKDSKFEDCVQDVKKKEGIKKSGTNALRGRVPAGQVKKSLWDSVDDDVEPVRPGPSLNVTGLGSENPAPGGSDSEARDELRPDGPGTEAKNSFEPNKLAKGAKLMLKSSEGEGSRGGKVIGHTASGKPIYKPSDDAIAHMRDHVNLQKRTAKGKLDEHASSHLHHVSKDYEAADHAHAAEVHRKEASNYKNSEKERAFHGAIADAHAAKAAGKPTPAKAAADKANAAAAKREATAQKKEAARKKETVAVTSGGHEIKNTHHVRTSAAGESIHEGPASSARHGTAFGAVNEPIETESGPHLSAEKHRDIAKYHRDQAHHHATQHDAHGGPKIGEHRLGTEHAKKMRQHEFAARHHEKEAAKKDAPNPDQGKLFEKSHGEGSRGGKVIGHTASGAAVYDHQHGAMEHLSRHGMQGSKLGASGIEISAEHHKQLKGMGFKGSVQVRPGGKAAHSAKEVHEFLKDKEVKKAMSAIDQLNKSGLELLDSFCKSEMPDEGHVPQELPTSMGGANGGEVGGVGAPSGNQSPPAADVARTAHIKDSTEEDNLRELAAVHGSPGVEKADLESDAGGEKLSKAWIDWDQAQDDGERLKAQFVSQLLNKSTDVTVGIGGKVAKPELQKSEVKPAAYFQKGGHVLYTDSEDQRIEKAMEQGLTFHQGQGGNYGARVQHDAECGGCGSLTKSYLSSCQECGLPLHGHVQDTQGLVMEKSVARSLLPSEDDDVAIG